jgi:hypothetical protein
MSTLNSNVHILKSEVEPIRAYYFDHVAELKIWNRIWQHWSIIGPIKKCSNSNSISTENKRVVKLAYIEVLYVFCVFIPFISGFFLNEKKTDKTHKKRVELLYKAILLHVCFLFFSWGWFCRHSNMTLAELARTFTYLHNRGFTWKCFVKTAR